VKKSAAITQEQLRTLFPRASKSVLEANSATTTTPDTQEKPAVGDTVKQGTPNETNDRGQIPNPKPKRHKKAALGAAVSGETEGVPRVTVRFIGYRVRPLDPDNFAGSIKDLLDGLRHAELIPGDEPWKIRLETEQVKVRSKSQEKTVIEV